MLEDGDFRSALTRTVILRLRRATGKRQGHTATVYELRPTHSARDEAPSKHLYLGLQKRGRHSQERLNHLSEGLDCRTRGRDNVGYLHRKYSQNLQLSIAGEG